MEIQRNKRLNWAFIVLAVLTVVLRLVSLVSRVRILAGVQVSYLLNVACAALPIAVMICSKRKRVSVTLTVLYFIAYGVMTCMTVYTGYFAWLAYLLIYCDGLIISLAIGIFPLLNATCKEKSKIALATVCLVLGVIETIWVVVALCTTSCVFQLENLWEEYWQAREYYREYYNEIYLPYAPSYCLMLFAIGIGILRDAPLEVRKEQKVQRAQKGSLSKMSQSKQTALFLSIFTGVLGVDRFYLGYTVSGIIKLLTAGGAGIWALIDFIRIGVDSLRPADGSPWVEETRDENIRSIAANMQAIAEKLEKLQAQNVPAEAEKPQTDGENQETHKVSLKK